MFKKCFLLCCLTITVYAQNITFTGPASASSNLPTVSPPSTITQNITAGSNQTQQQINQSTASKLSKTAPVAPQPIIPSTPVANDTTTAVAATPTVTPPPAATPTTDTTTTDNSTTPDNTTPPPTTLTPTTPPPNSSPNIYTGFQGANNPPQDNSGTTNKNSGWNIKY